MSKFKEMQKQKAAQRAKQEQEYAEKLMAMDDESFITELTKLHNGFVHHVKSIMHRSFIPKTSFNTVAESVAKNKEYALFNKAIWIPIVCSPRLFKILEKKAKENSNQPQNVHA